MENILFWLIVGIIAGWLTGLVVPDKAPGGIISDLVVGMVGAVAGGFLFSIMVGHLYGDWIDSTAIAFFGAVLFLFILRSVNRKWVSTD